MVPENAKINGVKLRFWQPNLDSTPMMSNWAIDSLIIDRTLNVLSLEPSEELLLPREEKAEEVNQNETSKSLRRNRIGGMESTFDQRLWWRIMNMNLTVGIG